MKRVFGKNSWNTIYMDESFAGAKLDAAKIAATFAIFRYISEACKEAGLKRVFEKNSGNTIYMDVNGIPLTIIFSFITILTL